MWQYWKSSPLTNKKTPGSDSSRPLCPWTMSSGPNQSWHQRIRACGLGKIFQLRLFGHDVSRESLYWHVGPGGVVLPRQQLAVHRSVAVRRSSSEHLCVSLQPLIPKNFSEKIRKRFLLSGQRCDCQILVNGEIVLVALFVESMASEYLTHGTWTWRVPNSIVGNPFAPA